MSEALETHPTTIAEAPPTGHERGRAPRPRRARSRSSLLAHGTPMVWLTGGMLALAVAMIVALLALIFVQGFATFWPEPIVKFTTRDGQVHMGEVFRDETYTPAEHVFSMMDASWRDEARAALDANGGVSQRTLVRTGNFRLTNEHFNWVEDYMVTGRTQPEWAVVLERTEWGRFYGFPKSFSIDGEVVAEGPEAVWEQYRKYHDELRGRAEQRKEIETDDIGRISAREEAARLELRQAELDHGPDSPQYREVQEEYRRIAAETQAEFARLREEIQRLDAENARYVMVMETADGKTADVELATVVRGYPANQLSTAQRWGVYAARWWEFLTGWPREANSEGGVWPAIVGTIVMTLLMSLAVVPFGVLAALYIREYARGGAIVSAIRIAINNLAGVPSIVYGVFGLGFFCYIVGGWIDGGPENATGVVLPEGPWWAALGGVALMTVTGILLWMACRPKRGEDRSAGKQVGRTVAGLLLTGGAIGLVVLLATTPFFDGFYEARLADGNPTFGKTALVWASLTLALLTLPVVIVATEEALSAVPNSMREGSYACGASKWQTIKRIVLPRAMPGIMTGMILAVARGAGEVAPLMLVGAVKFTQKLPVDAQAPFLHPDRSFMHLGFHIFDVGFQGQNAEAGKPMVYTTTLLLIVIVAALNLLAIWVRSRLRRKFIGGQF